MIYVAWRNLTLPDNQLLRGVEIFPFTLAKKKERKFSRVCHIFPSQSCRMEKNFSLLFSVKLIVCSSPEAARPKKMKTKKTFRRPKSLKQESDEKCSNLFIPSQFISKEIYMNIRSSRELQRTSHFLSRLRSNENEKLKR